MGKIMVQTVVVPALAKNARACPERSRRDGAAHVSEWNEGKAGPPACQRCREIQKMHGLKKRITGGEDFFGWSALSLVLIAALILDKGSAPHKWHAAIMWTFCALFGLVIFGRTKRGSWIFWIFWATCLALHISLMWLIFAQLLPRLILGTLYVVPIAFIEALFLIGIFSKLERRLHLVLSRKDAREFLVSRRDHKP
jgi:hypothetical protein